jgi:hypothetical protein
MAGLRAALPVRYGTAAGDVRKVRVIIMDGRKAQ